MENWDGASMRRDFELRQVTIREVMDIIGQLSNSSTMVHDGLDALTLKLVTSSVMEPIQHILSLSISSKIYCGKLESYFHYLKVESWIKKPVNRTDRSPFSRLFPR